MEKTKIDNGKFVISLDFELMWGVRDIETVESYGENLRGVHQVVPRLLETFDNHQIRATFSTVGFLFFQNKIELLNNLPTRLPNYSNKKLSPYLGYFELVGANSKIDPYHYAPDLIKLIQQYPQHEIGSQTFSHYYCLEDGQDKDDFEADLQNAVV